MKAPGLLLVVVVLMAGCGSEILDDQNDLIVLNESPCDITVYVDGREVFTLAAGSDRALSDIGDGPHVFEAVNTRGELVERKVVELAPAEDFFFVIDHC
ncbi:MAG: hypothetical protein N2447_08290 [Thermoanaerobaculum sp.]|nr:hypothetical protein [Thermoanaerobaculum sp.]